MSVLLPEPVTPSVPTPAARPRTAADWHASLGDVPLDRILFDPLPGRATVDDLIRLADKEKRLCELVDGTLVEKPMGLEESVIASRIIYFLQAFVMKRKLGVVAGEAGMLKLLRAQVRIPDVSFLSIETVTRWQPGEKVPAIAPDLAVEVLSESNTRAEMAIKLAEYFDAGTRLVWYVDPRTRTVDVYTSVDTVTRLTDADTLTGGDVLPGFEARVAEFFAIE